LSLVRKIMAALGLPKDARVFTFKRRMVVFNF
jgi:hypothetical protein